MPKKQAASLIDVNTSIFAVLSPGNGYLKEVYGDVEFIDALPRASGSFKTKEEAHAAWERAIVRARGMVEDAKKRFGGTPDNYFEQKAKKVLNQAQNAILVEITIHGVI